MEVIPLSIPEEVPSDAIPALIDRAIDAMDLVVALRTKMKEYPGGVHWHVRPPKTTGTMEITYDPTTHRAWFSTRPGRTKDWVIEAMEKLTIEINTPRSPH